MTKRSRGELILKGAAHWGQLGAYTAVLRAPYLMINSTLLVGPPLSVQLLRLTTQRPDRRRKHIDGKANEDLQHTST